MKKIYLLGSLALLMGLVSCHKDDYNYQQSAVTSALNIITELDGSNPIVTQGDYQFDYKFNSTTQLGTISTNSLIIDNTKHDFTTIEQNYKSNGYNLYFVNPQSANGNLSNSTFFITPQYYYPALFVEGMALNENPYNLQPYVIAAQYTLDNKYLVRTFQPNTLFYGKTITSYPGTDGNTVTYEPGAGENEQPMVYQLSLNIKDNKADVVIYNAKFAPPMPGLAEIYLKDLDVDFTGCNVKVTGSNIIPLAPEGEDGELSEYPGFPFNNFELVTQGGDLTKCIISYTVATRFKGYFEGSYVVEMKF